MTILPQVLRIIAHGFCQIADLLEQRPNPASAAHPPSDADSEPEPPARCHYCTKKPEPGFSKCYNHLTKAEKGLS